MHIIGCQLDLAWEDREENFRRVETLLGSITVPANSLIVLPEMFPCGFTMDVEKVREGDPSPTTGFSCQLHELARRRTCGMVCIAQQRGGTTDTDCLGL